MLKLKFSTQKKLAELEQTSSKKVTDFQAQIESFTEKGLEIEHRTRTMNKAQQKDFNLNLFYTKDTLSVNKNGVSKPVLWSSSRKHLLDFTFAYQY
jgi:hypothetical protein